MTELICGVFPSRGQAEEALDALIRAGHDRANLGDDTKLTDALGCLGVAPDHASWYEQQVRDGAALVTLLTDDGGQVAEIMREHGAIQRQSSSADLSMDVADDTAGAFPGWEPGGPGYSGLVPQQHEDGVIFPSEPEE